MKQNLYAYTAPGCEYPGYVSINRTESGIEVSVREAPALVDGVAREGRTVRFTVPESEWPVK